MKKILDPKNLPYFGAIVQAVLFSIAGNQFFSAFGWLVGLGVGAVVNWSMALASSRVSDIARSRKPLAYISLIGLFALSPVIICSTLGWSVSNFSWSVAADLSILLTGAVVGKSLVVTETKPKVARKKKEVAETLPQEPEPLPKVARKHIADNELLAYLAETPGQTQEQVAEHFGVTRQAIGARLKTLYAVKDKS